MEVILAVGVVVWAVNAIVNANEDDPDLSIQNTVMTRMTSNAITSVHTDCITIANTSQNISITADNDYSNNLQNMNPLDTTVACDDIVTNFGRILDRHDPSGGFRSYFMNYTSSSQVQGIIYDMDITESVADSQSSVNTTDTGTISQDNALVRYLCEPLTNSVIINNINQVMNVSMDTNCEAATDIANTVTNSVSGYIDSTLSNDQDIFGVVTDSLSGSTQSISNSYATIMGTYAETNIRHILDNTVAASQNITFENVSSMVAMNFYQNSDINSDATAEFVAQTNNDITQSVEYQLMQTLENQNNTVSDVTSILVDGIEQMTDFIDNTAGAYITIVVVILVCGVFCLVNYRLYKDRLERRKGAPSDESTTTTTTTTTPGQQPVRSNVQYQDTANPYYSIQPTYNSYYPIQPTYNPQDQNRPYKQY